MSRSRRPSTLIAALLLGVLAWSPAHGQEPAAWPDKYFNPKPADGDLILPLPCGGRMAFRPVATPAEDTPLADRAIRLGGTDEDTGFADYIRREHILGSLVGPDGGRLFYIGKYEVTRDQYAAVMNDSCPKPAMGGRLPQSAISWFDAVGYARRLSEWQLTNHADALPHVQGVAAYLRLPTEVEWEYAARGGAAVSEAQFRERIFPIEGPLSDYAWYQGPESAGGKLNLVGLLKPNPLGLYDMLGNVEEFVLEPFYMNRIGRRHGQPGGFVAKGGSFQDPGDRLRTAMRREYDYFNQETGKALALDSFGFRLVLAAPVELNLQETTRLREQWLAARGRRVDTGNDPVAAIKALADQTTDLDLKERLQSIEELFARRAVQAQRHRGPGRARVASQRRSADAHAQGGQEADRRGRGRAQDRPEPGPDRHAGALRRPARQLAPADRPLDPGLHLDPVPGRRGLSGGAKAGPARRPGRRPRGERPGGSRHATSPGSRTS